MNGKSVRSECRDPVALVTMARSETNALNLELVEGLSGVLKQLKQEKGVRSLVITSSGDKFFSIGFDIPELFGLPRDDFAHFFKSFNRLCLDLFTFPKPVIAAVTGHAVAGGCIVALCCDYRFIADGKKKMGLNEIKLGVPIPYPAEVILKQLVGYRRAREIVDSGEFYLPEALKEMGLVDEVLPQDLVLTKAMEKGKAMGSFLPDAYAMIKNDRVELVAAQINLKLKEKEEKFLDLWYAREVRERLKRAMEKF